MHVRLSCACAHPRQGMWDWVTLWLSELLFSRYVRSVAFAVLCTNEDLEGPEMPQGMIDTYQSPVGTPQGGFVYRKPPQYPYSQQPSPVANASPHGQVCVCLLPVVTCTVVQFTIMPFTKMLFSIISFPATANQLGTRPHSRMRSKHVV